MTCDKCSELNSKNVKKHSENEVVPINESLPFGNSKDLLDSASMRNETATLCPACHKDPLMSLNGRSESFLMAMSTDSCDKDEASTRANVDVESQINDPSSLAQSDEDRPKGSRRSVTGSNKSRGGLPQNLKFSFFCLITCAILISLVLVLYLDTMSPIVERIAMKLGYQNEQYAAIFDAGSTGSRVLAYKFHRSILDNKLILDEELFKERKPGLSSFVDDPAAGAHTIKLLIDEARQFIPKKKWAETPIVLKATAGLRLLPPQKAKLLLNAVREIFTKSEFIVADNAVEIMDGTDEGIFSWFTVNFLLGKLSKSNQAAALDLGGASTQVTFIPADPKQIPLSEKYMHSVRVSNKELDLFTHSYLGLGLMAVRHSVFTNKLPKNQTTIASECINPIIRNRPWSYSGIEYVVSGKENAKSTAENPVVEFENCLNKIKSIVIPLIKPKPITLKQHPVAAFSYFFDRAIETGLIDPFQGGEITIEEFRKKAQEVCATANSEQPFMCLDLSYISVLLREGYGLEDKKKIKLYKKIDGHEISWALGCAWNVLTSNEKTTP